MQAVTLCHVAQKREVIGELVCLYSRELIPYGIVTAQILNEGA